MPNAAARVRKAAPPWAFWHLASRNPRALALFDRAIALNAGNPRALVGKGLTLLASGDAIRCRPGYRSRVPRCSIVTSVRGSRRDGHISPQRIMRKRGPVLRRPWQLDANFSESHGGLAVLDIMAGNLQSAQKNCEIALKSPERSEKLRNRAPLGQTFIGRRAREKHASCNQRTAAIGPARSRPGDVDTHRPYR